LKGLGRLARMATELHLHEFPDTESRRWLNTWGSNLRVLHLNYTLSPPQTAFFRSALTASLVGLSNLVELHITATGDPSEMQSLDFASMIKVLRSNPHNPFPAVTTLSLSLPLFSPAVFTFLDYFPRLENLSLRATTEEVSDDWESPPFTNSSFPHVVALRFGGYFVQATINSVTKERFPSLESLELGLQDGCYYVRDWLEFVLPEVGPGLSSLRLYENGRLSLSDTREAQELVSAVNPTLVVLNHADVPLLPAPAVCTSYLSEIKSTSPHHRDLVASCRPFVRCLTSYLAEEVARADRNDDDASFVGLAVSLKALELERLARIG
jgi:hypothetical protein